MLIAKCETNCYHLAQGNNSTTNYLKKITKFTHNQRLRESLRGWRESSADPASPALRTCAFHRAALWEPGPAGLRPQILNNQPRSEMASYYCYYCYFSYQTILRHSVTFIKVKRVSCPGALLASSCLLGLKGDSRKP